MTDEQGIAWCGDHLTQREINQIAAAAVDGLLELVDERVAA